VDVGAREGVVERTEREMIHKRVRAGGHLVREVMVPRPDMFCLDVSTPPSEILPVLREQTALARAGLRGDRRPDRGVLYTKDLLPHLGGLPPAFELRAHLHPPYFVPESKRADALLREFQAKKLHLAIVVGRVRGHRRRWSPWRICSRSWWGDPRRVRRGRSA
jgi:CBS domain containing-hemolysin-like protein